MTTSNFEDNHSSAAPTGATVISPVFDGQRNTRGRFVPGSVGNPKGRPRGACNKATLMARMLLEDKVMELAQKVVKEALGGNTSALRLCFERIAPKPKDAPIEFTLPENANTAEEILAAHNALVQAMANGEITPKEAESVSKTLEARRRSWETVKFSQRLEAIERHLEIRTGTAPSEPAPEFTAANGTQNEPASSLSAISRPWPPA